MAMAIPMAMTMAIVTFLLLATFCHSSPTYVSFAKTSTRRGESSGPLTAKAAAIRYWNRKITNSIPQPSFLTSKLSPLSPLQLATYTADFASISTSADKLASFCTDARLLCATSPLSQSLSSSTSGNFTSYDNSNFTNYATKGPGLSTSFTAYSNGDNVPIDTFRRYSRDAVGSDDKFTSYSLDGNVVTTNFTSYSTSAVGGTGDFTGYHTGSNVPNLKFSNYDTDATGPDRTFTSYAKDTNAGDESFAGYGKRSNGVDSTFASYSENSNVMGSGFSGYGEDGNGNNNKFSSYGENGNVPELNFKAYGENGNGGVDTFTSYRNQSNVGDDTFSSYGKKANDEQSSFAGYGESFNPGSDNFNNYGEGSFDDNINFTSYAGDLTTFKAYANAKSGNTFTFKSYANSSSVPHSLASSATELNGSNVEKKKKTKPANGKSVNKWLVEPGKFFRESSLRKGTVMPMPDIRDKMPARAFLPRTIASRIPFSAEEVTRLFRMPADTAMGKAVGDTVSECKRAPSRGETKRCATSAEDIFDFATEVLGGNVVVRSTESTEGSGGSILIGHVEGINGGAVTKSVSCHQSLFPYLVYYCHSVPKVRVYQADILDVDRKEKINRGVAICHVDTSDWSAGHGAFVALGSGPGKIEVCHWIFEGDMTWAVAD